MFHSCSLLCLGIAIYFAFHFRNTNCSILQAIVMPKATTKGRARHSDDHPKSAMRPSRHTKRPQRFLDHSPMSPLAPPREHSPVASTSAGTGTGTAGMQMLVESLHSMQEQITHLQTQVASTSRPALGRKETPPPENRAPSDSGDGSADDASLTSIPRASRPRKRAARVRRRSRTRSSPEDVRPERQQRARKRRHLSPPSLSSTSGEDNSLSDSSDTDFEDYDRPKASFGSVSGHTVSEKIKAKILSNKFHEMAELLPNFKSKKQTELTITNSKDNTPRFVQARQNLT